MATTQISDVYVPGPFDRQSLLMTKQLSAFWQSGILREDPLLSQFASGPGSIIEVPKLRPLGGDRNIGSDNPGSSSSPNKIAHDVEKAIKHFSNNSWAQMDLVASLTDPRDPLGQLAGTIGGYWNREYQKILIASLRGILADNESNDDEDMVYSVATDAEATVGASEKISHSAITRARLTAGDALGDLQAIAMHSAVYGTLLEAEAIRFELAQDVNQVFMENPSDAKAQVPFYGDLRVIVDDGLPAVAGTYRITYTSVLFGTGSIGYAEASPKTPSEVDRDPAVGDGEGEEILYSRRHTVLHPFGFEWTSSSMAGKSPTNAELANAANWNRVYPERKQVPIAFLKTNG